MEVMNNNLCLFHQVLIFFFHILISLVITHIKSDLLAKMSPQPTTAKYTCLNCQTNFESADFQRVHFKTEWHMYNLKRKVCNLSPISQDDFNDIKGLASTISVPKQAEKDRKTRARLDSLAKQNDKTPIHLEEDSESNWEEVDDEELLDEDYDDAEAAEMLAKVVPEDTCLFCNKKSVDIKANIKHMDLIHGFFIPEEQYLIDLEGLVEYLGFKVGAGATCLWCNKQFTTLHGARLHMLYKDHCKIQYDQQKAIDEFKDFYDYSDQIQIPMKPLNELAIPKKRSERHAEYQNALLLKHKSSNQSRQLLVRKNPSIVAGTFQSKNIKKFNAQHAKRLLHIGMTNNNAVRGRLRRQNPM